MKELLPESIYNTPAIEAWLSGQARRGARVLHMEGYRLPEDLTGHLDDIAAALAKGRQ